MRIALDGTPLSVQTGGIRRYTEELSRALAALDDIALFSDQPVSGPFDASSVEVYCGRPRSLLERRWWSYGLPRALGRWNASIFHGTDFAVPYSRAVPSVVTVHDLSPWRDDEASDRVRRRGPASIRRANLVITPTEAVRREVIEEFRLHPGRVCAIPLASSRRFQPREPAPNGYVLYAGTVEPRKNISTLIEASRAIKLDVVIAGRCRPRFSLGALPENVQLRGAVTDDELADLFAGAAVFVYPSTYEGFGLPVLEAMQMGVPVIASRIPAIEEVSGGAAAVLVEPHDVRGWAEALQAIASNEELRALFRERGLRRAAEFSWERTARKTREAYAEAIARAQ